MVETRGTTPTKLLNTLIEKGSSCSKPTIHNLLARSDRGRGVQLTLSPIQLYDMGQSHNGYSLTSHKLSGHNLQKHSR